MLEKYHKLFLDIIFSSYIIVLFLLIMGSYLIYLSQGQAQADKLTTVKVTQNSKNNSNNISVPVIYKIQTSKPVVFLTIDDGIYKESSAASLMQSNNIKASFFLVYRFIKDDPAYFKDLSNKTGSIIENHSYDHFVMSNLKYSDQYKDIKNDSTYVSKQFNHRPTLFRPSGGDFNQDTLRAAANNGIKALVEWNVTDDNATLQFNGSDHLQPGDIVLMHFRPNFSADLQTFVSAMQQQGLHTELLENWIK